LKGVAILGSTGSVGIQTLDVIKFMKDTKVVALAAGSRWQKILEQAKEFNCNFVAIEDEDAAKAARTNAKRFGLENLTVESGKEGILHAATLQDADVVLHAIPGFKGIEPLIASLSSGKVVAFAGKEALVSAGELIRPLINSEKTNLIPVDSEHSAIFQCLLGQDRTSLKEIILTASGGALRDMTPEDISQVEPDQVLKHPTWSMGPKITVDSATLFNKTLEVIEAFYLFDVDYDAIKVVIHRQSIVHSMVTFSDGTTMCQAAVPDMRLPIAFALTYPKRTSNVIPTLEPYVGTLTFEKPDVDRFPCLTLGYEAGKLGGTAPCVLSYADELLVQQFLKGNIRITDIYSSLRRILQLHRPMPVDSLESLERAKSFVDSAISSLAP
jgi:1-deoxy-D-xylulose-5-phosphate reductoisomerase